jgi:hypothetical protein
MNYYLISIGAVFLAIGYFLTKIIFDILLRGFAPLIPSRPWVVQELLAELELPKENAVCLAFSTGRSGFFYALEKKYPGIKLLANEHAKFPYLVSKLQTIIRPTKIKIIHERIHRVNVKEADFIYCHLDPEDLRGMGKKFKFECRPDTIIISTGFNIPDLEPFKIVPLEDRKGKYDWLSRNQKLFQLKSKKYKKENKAFFYRV